MKVYQMTHYGKNIVEYLKDYDSATNNWWNYGTIRNIWERNRGEYEYDFRGRTFETF
jgi:hypothetical protein